jgi:uncharacterized protein
MSLRTLLLAGAPVLALLGSDAADATPAASFDCAKARAPVEKLICSNDELAGLDAALGRAYAPSKLPPGKAAALREEQRQWLGDRLIRCNVPGAGNASPPATAAACLIGLYRERLKALAATPAAVAAPLPPYLEAAVAELRGDADMPILLPSRLPLEGKIYASGEGQRGSYRLTLAHTRDCDANACFVGFFSGERGGALAAPERVKLASGIEARFMARSCGGSCAPASIEWVAGGVLYTIQLRLGDADDRNAERILKALAEDAIAAGPR